MGLSEAKDVCFGGQAVNRIYQNGEIVWNRADWMRWDTGEKAVQNDLVTTPIGGEEVTAASTPMAEGHKAYAGMITTESNAYLLMELPGETWAQALENGARWLSTSETKVEGDYLIYLLDSNESGIVWRLFRLDNGGTSSVPTRGSNCLGLVRGWPGDYPDNGLHRDGYWYVRC